MCSHIKFLGMRTIWQNQLAHHFTELTIRLNKQDEVGITTRLRIREAQLKCRYLDNILSNKSELTCTNLKHNLAYKVVLEAKKLGFSFQESSSYEVKLEVKGASILSLLEEKEISRYRESRNLNIYTLEQVITREGNTLLIWQQIKLSEAIKEKDTS